ncbi:MAG: DNA gyrase inhibitor YacG [Planctomycetes bacterium]|nr:DNA gyrase inhibitor YacG [Planctomycetota bacterium]
MIRPRPCPICRKNALPAKAGEKDTFPFCSERCRQIDLLRWSKGQYAIVEPLSQEQLEEMQDGAGPEAAADEAE